MNGPTLTRHDNAGRIWPCLLLALALTGCASGMVARRPHPPPAPEALMAAVMERQTGLRTVNMETRTTSWLGGERVRATVQMLVERSGKLRFEAEMSLQGQVAALTVSGGVFRLLDLQRRTFQTGPACPQNVASLIRIPLLPHEVAAILMGDAPLGSDARAVAVNWDPRRAAEVLEIRGAESGGATGRIWVGLQPEREDGGPRWKIVSVEGEDRQGTRWRVSYEDFKRAGAFLLPATIRFAEPGKSFDDGVEIVVRERQVNPGLQDAAFVLEAPPGYPVETVRCDDRRMRESTTP